MTDKPTQIDVESYTFLGHDLPFWIELKERAERNNIVANLDEIVKLRGKISFYEERLRQMIKVMGN